VIGSWTRGPALLTASLGLHLLALTAIWARFSADPPAPLVVDLEGLDAPAAAPTGRDGDRDGVASSPPGVRDRSSPGAVPAPTRRIERATIPAPPASRAPAGPEPPAPPVPPPPAPIIATPPAVTPPTEPPPSVPAPAPPPAATATASGTEPGAAGSSPMEEAERRGGEGAAASGTREGAARPSGDDASGAGGPSGQSGALLALARPGEGRGGVPPEYAPYLARFRQRVEEALVYPLAARRQGHAGRVELAVLLEPSGRIGRVDVTVSSANAALDEAAVDAVRAVKPIPFPEGLPRRSLLVRLPLVFQLR
jgi:periplasmic protein TonB